MTGIRLARAASISCLMYSRATPPSSRGISFLPGYSISARALAATQLRSGRPPNRGISGLHQPRTAETFYEGGPDDQIRDAGLLLDRVTDERFASQHKSRWWQELPQDCTIGYFAKISSTRLNAFSTAACGVRPPLMTSARPSAIRAYFQRWHRPG